MPNQVRPVPIKLERMITATEASRLLHVHVNTLRRWSNNGIVRTYRIGPRADRRFAKSDIANLLVNNEVNAVQKLYLRKDKTRS